MVSAIGIGATIGFVALIALHEFEFKLCRLCCVFWCSVLYCLITGEWIHLGVVNLAAHISYLTLQKVAYVEEIRIPFGNCPKIENGTPGGKNFSQGVQETEISSEHGSLRTDSKRA